MNNDNPVSRKQGKCVEILAQANGQAIDQDVDANVERVPAHGPAPCNAEGKHVACNLVVALEEKPPKLRHRTSIP